jgi:hypothetical protein
MDSAHDVGDASAADEAAAEAFAEPITHGVESALSLGVGAVVRLRRDTPMEIIDLLERQLDDGPRTGGHGRPQTGFELGVQKGSVRNKDPLARREGEREPSSTIDPLRLPHAGNRGGLGRRRS